MSEGQTCYEQDEKLCEDQMCLRVGCRLRNKRLEHDLNSVPALVKALEEIIAFDRKSVRRPIEVDPAGNTYEVTDVDGHCAAIARTALAAYRSAHDL